MAADDRYMAFPLTAWERRASARYREQQAQTETSGFVRLRQRNGQESMDYFAACSLWGLLAVPLAMIGMVLFVFGHGKGTLADVGLAFGGLFFILMPIFLVRWAQFYREGQRYRANGVERS